MSTHNDQNVAFKYQVSVKNPRLLKEMAESRSETEKCKINLKNCIISESKGIIENKLKSQLEEILIGQRQFSLSRNKTSCN